LAKALTDADWTQLEAAIHVALLNKRTVAVFRVVSREREVAQRVQVPLLDLLPVLAERLSPRLREVLGLWQDVLDGVLVDDDALLAAMILEASQPIRPAPEVVEIAYGKLATEFVILREAAIPRESEEMSLD